MPLKEYDPNIPVENKRMPYMEIELNKAATLFKWSGDIEIPFNMELILRKNGSIGYNLNNDKWVFGDWTGLKDELNRFTTYVCRTLSTTPETYELDREDVVVCGNNPLFASDIPAMDFIASMKAETDKSIYYQLVNSRNIPMIAAVKDQIKKEIESAFKKMEAGRPVVVTTSLMEDLQRLDITDPEAIAKMQYLSSFYDVLEKRNALIFGVDVPLVDKRAQVNENELENFGDISSLNFLAAYEMRLAFVEEMKQRAGVNLKCVRNPVYADEASKEEIESEEAQEEAEEKIEETDKTQEGEKEENEENN